MSFEEDFIAHYGKPGMKWGQRRAQNRAMATANANFKRDVKLTRRGKGLERQVSVRDGQLMVTNNYRNANKQSVGKDYAESVIAEASRKNKRVSNAKVAAVAVVGAALVARMLIK